MITSSSYRVAGWHYETARAVELEIAGGQIAATRDIDERAAGQTLCWIAPGFIDIQSNGYGGQEFASPTLTAEKVAEIAALQASFGVTQFCPTVTTASREVILHAMATIARACRESPEVAYVVAGIHLEGPYITSEDGPRGAHPLAHCRPPDWDEFRAFQDASDGRIRILTMSPEFPGSCEFIERCTQSGVVVSIGHTAATSRQVRDAVDAGAELSTHLGNGAHRELRRHPNYIWDQLADDRLMASLIVDGHHLPPEVVKTMVRAKSPELCILVSDLSGLGGMPPGRYQTELCELEVLPDGRLVIAGQDQLLAGASRPIGVGVANVMRYAGVDLPSAIHMASRNPARLLNRDPVELVAGNAADLVLFELKPGPDQAPCLAIRSTITGGHQRTF